MPDVISSGTGDGEVLRAKKVGVNTWSQMRSASVGTSVDDTSQTMQLLNARTAGFKGRPDNWWLSRLLMPFNTGAIIPAMAIIDACTLGLYISSNSSMGSYQTGYIFQGNQSDETNLTINDYNNFVASILIGGSIGVGSNGWKNSVFNSDGLAAIRKSGEASEGGGSAGWTKVFVRGKHDYLNISPVKSTHSINAFFRTAEGVNSPTLTITWSMPPRILNIKGNTLDIKGNALNI